MTSARDQVTPVGSPVFETLRLGCAGGVGTIRLSRPSARNALNSTLLAELAAALGVCESDASCEMVVLEGEGGVFCRGMDFAAMAALPAGRPRVEAEALARPYMDLLRRIATLERPVVAKVEGEVLAGGLGLVAASDLVVATPGSRFSLPEVLWGLLPAMVLPYLVRRIGYQAAHRMALTSAIIPAPTALGMSLVDEVTDVPDVAVARLHRRLRRVRPATVGALKRYMRQTWPVIDQEQEERAVAESARLMFSSDVRRDLLAFVERGELPWDADGPL